MSEEEISCFELPEETEEQIVDQIFSRLASFKTLTPLTSNPEEWMEVGGGTWQNNRSSDCFSTDGGKTYYSIDDKNREIKVSQNE